tara:strand:+ start:200 stop:415 length:216 start_codon:yes stop_codon:yes gene_type:complete
MTDEAQTNENVELTINDLMVMRAVLDTATQAGIFKAADLSTLGTTFDKLNMICEDFIAKNQKPESEPAEAE